MPNFSAKYTIDFSQYPTGQLYAIRKSINTELRIREKNKRKGYNDYKFIANSAFVYEPIPFRKNLNVRQKYLPQLLNQNWEHIISGDDTHNSFYVYAHLDLRKKMDGCREVLKNCKNIPFYIGKGTGDRYKKFKRNQGHQKILNEVKKAGFNINNIPFILSNNLTEKEAFILESKLIYFFQTIYENDKHGHLINLDVPPRPQFIKGQP